MTTFEQDFFYGVRNCLCNSITYIISHEADGQVDFFRETVTNVVPLNTSQSHDLASQEK